MANIRLTPQVADSSVSMDLPPLRVANGRVASARFPLQMSMTEFTNPTGAGEPGECGLADQAAAV